MKSDKMQSDFGIFNMNGDDSQIDKVLNPSLDTDSTMHKDMLEHLHNLLIRQAGECKPEASRPEHTTTEDQFYDLKAHLELESKIGGGKKWNWDTDFAQLIDLRKHRAILENYELNNHRVRNTAEAAQ